MCNYPRMKRLGGLVVVVLLLTACGSSGGNSPPTPEPTVPAAAATTDDASPSCALPDTGDVIVRMESPNTDTIAQVLGGVDLANCTSTADLIASTSPTTPGSCTWVALASDNPGYDDGASPAAPLKKVIEAIGPACNR